MRRMIFSLPEELFIALQRLAEERHVPMAEVARTALKREIATARPKPKSIGVGASGHRDTSERIGEEGFVPEPFR